MSTVVYDNGDRGLLMVHDDAISVRHSDSIVRAPGLWHSFLFGPAAKFFDYPERAAVVDDFGTLVPVAAPATKAVP
ncbi:Uncharacterised protein [Bordetella ansorpii]|uniref:Uncharacterized protein n=1 Tax=Bordetella ansorpii TaxID=288768 RepID=A0A157QP85_9BORD|nr:hypothetical protein [Bordetella ansorpii]SAI47587.1 Uncharacterised protein [Bordetella ansorpii]